MTLILLSGCDAGGETPATPTPTRTISTSTSTPSEEPSEEPSVAPSSTTSPRPDAAACAVPARVAGEDLERLPGPRPRIALTFDAGANADGVRSILRALAIKEAPATFFLTGRFVRTFPQKSARIARLHLVGNHTDSHPNLTALTDAGVVAEIRAAERTIVAVAGQDPRRFFRFPYGARTAQLIAAVNGLCYVPFRWTVDTLGWQGTEAGRSAASVLKRVLDGASPGAIVLMHVGSNPDDRSTFDADALPRIIDRLRAAGYRLVRLSSVMRAPP